MGKGFPKVHRSGSDCQTVHSLSFFRNRGHLFSFFFLCRLLFCFVLLDNVKQALAYFHALFNVSRKVSANAVATMRVSYGCGNPVVGIEPLHEQTSGTHRAPLLHARIDSAMSGASAASEQTRPGQRNYPATHKCNTSVEKRACSSIDRRPPGSLSDAVDQPGDHRQQVKGVEG